MLYFSNCQIAHDDSTHLQHANVLVEEGKIKAISHELVCPQGAREIPCEGKIMMPAMFDAHVHFREPGFEAKENIASGVAAAINGGVTGVVMMPNTSPAIDSPAVVRTVLDSGNKHAPFTVLTSGCITKGRAGKELAGIDGMRNLGVKMLTDDGDGIDDPSVLFRAMQYANEFGMFFASHCEVKELAGLRALTEGTSSYRLGIKGSPPCAEEIMIDRDIRLAHATGAHIHIQHVSSALGMETIRWWKERGARVTAEVAPHHLLFCEEDIGDFDTNYKMNPPLRTRMDNAALIGGLMSGVFDLIATDHAPHTSYEKSLDFVSAPNGITGLETALISLYDAFIAEGVFGWDLVVKRYSSEPRKMMGLSPVPIREGGNAELLLFNPNATTTFTPEYMQSKSINTPFVNKTLRGAIDFVMKENTILLER